MGSNQDAYVRRNSINSFPFSNLDSCESCVKNLCCSCRRMYEMMSPREKRSLVSKLVRRSVSFHSSHVTIPICQSVSWWLFRSLGIILRFERSHVLHDTSLENSFPLIPYSFQRVSISIPSTIFQPITESFLSFIFIVFILIIR